jgi:hypothetical protein
MSHGEAAGAHRPIVLPKLQRGVLASVHEAFVVHSGAQVEVETLVERFVHVSHAVPVAHGCPQAGENVLHVPPWQLAAADAPEAIREPSSAPSRPSKQPQPG